MDWLEEQEGTQRALDSAFTVLNEGPPPLTARQIKAKKDQTACWEEAARQLRLQAFPSLYTQESEESRLQRAEAFDTCWGAIQQRIDSVMESTDALVFASLLDLAKRHHMVYPAPLNLPRHGLHRIPTGLVLAGGVNSADHVRTFPNLAAHLRTKGCYVAILPPAAFSRSLAEAINSTLRQFSGLSTSGADQFEALAEWYVDEIGAGRELTVSNDDPATEREETDYTGDENMDDENMDDDDAPSGSGGRTLRTRPAGGGGRVKVATPEQLANRSRPLIIIVESTEAVAPSVLEDLVTVLSEGYPSLPVTLVLGLTTTAAALQAALPSHLLDRALNCHNFDLATAIHRLDTLVSRVLLGSWPGLLLDAPLVGALWGHFLEHYFSPSIVVQGWKVAALEHFRNYPGAALVAAGMQGDAEALRTAASTLQGPEAAEVKRAVGATRGGAGVGDALYAVINSWRRWALALHWMVAAAADTGLSNGYTFWQLFRDALAPGFGSSSRGKELLGRLNRSLSRMDPEQLVSIADNLLKIAEGEEGSDWRKCPEVVSAIQEFRDLRAHADGDASMAAPPGARSAEAVASNRAMGSSAQGTLHDEGEEELLPQGPAAKKNERFYSKASRKIALMAKSLEKVVKASVQMDGGSSCGGGGSRNDADARQTSSTRIAAWLIKWLQAALHTPPTVHPAASAFTCRKGFALDCLSAAPRESIHNALTRPDLFLYPLGGEGAGPSGSTAPPAQLGVSSRAEDACVAYHLFDQDPAYSNVADWFTAFREVFSGEDAAVEDGSVPDPKGKKSKGGVGRSDKGKEKMGTPGANARAERTRELAARFSQAAAELQFVGLVRPAKKRRGDHVQRAAHMPAALFGA